MIERLNKHWQEHFSADYDKADARIYQRLSPLTDQAIANAKWVREKHHAPESVHHRLQFRDRRLPPGWPVAGSFGGCQRVGLGKALSVVQVEVDPFLNSLGVQGDLLAEDRLGVVLGGDFFAGLGDLDAVEARGRRPADRPARWSEC